MTDELTLRVCVVRAGDVDREVASLPWVTFVRRDGALFVRCPAGDEANAIAALARAGLDATRAPISGPRRGLRPAIVGGLTPFASGEVVDTVFIRRPPLGEAIDLVRRLTHDVLRRRRRERRERVRSLLRDDDALLAWRRVVWADAAVLRSRRVPDARPLVFDPTAADRGEERLVFARAAALARWVGA